MRTNHNLYEVLVDEDGVTVKKYMFGYNLSDLERQLDRFHLVDVKLVALRVPPPAEIDDYER